MACHLSSQLSLLSQIWYLKTKLVSKEKGIKIKKTYQRVDMACHLSSKLSFGRPRDAKGRRETMIGQCDCARDFREQGGGGIRSITCRFDNPELQAVSTV